MNIASTTPATRNCAIYARSATSDSSQLAEQVASCRSFIRDRGWTTNEANIVTEGGAASKPTVSRSGLQQLLAAIKAEPRPFHCLVLADLARFSRHTEDMLSVLEEFAYHGVSVCAIDNHIDTSDQNCQIHLELARGLAPLDLKNLRKKLNEVSRARL